MQPSHMTAAVCATCRKLEAWRMQAAKGAEDTEDGTFLKLAAEEAELDRARERLTQKHRNTSRWARRALKRGQTVMDDGELLPRGDLWHACWSACLATPVPTAVSPSRALRDVVSGALAPGQAVRGSHALCAGKAAHDKLGNKAGRLQARTIRRLRTWRPNVSKLPVSAEGSPHTGHPAGAAATLLEGISTWHHFDACLRLPPWPL